MRQATWKIKNQNKKILLIVFILIACFMPLVASVQAQVRLETGLPGVPVIPAGQELPSYINYLFIFGLGLITFFALGFMTIGGVMYILAAGNIAKVEDAKDMIKQALLGLGLMLVSYLLLRTINPDLVNLRNPKIDLLQFKGGSFPQPAEEFKGGGGGKYGGGGAGGAW
ncbi:hypothetical protein HY838_00710 [Candidatus Azambacteria bacterium]|nr:hypothetical protein [Candidatus Azambacteria bacterium]